MVGSSQKGPDHDSDLKGWMGPPGLGSNVPSIPGVSGGVTSPPLFDIVKSTPEAERRFHSGEAVSNLSSRRRPDHDAGVLVESLGSGFPPE